MRRRLLQCVCLALAVATQSAPSWSAVGPETSGDDAANTIGSRQDPASDLTHRVKSADDPASIPPLVFCDASEESAVEKAPLLGPMIFALPPAFTTEPSASLVRSNSLPGSTPATHPLRC